MNIEYLGEHLWFGNLGHSLVILAFVAALFSAVSYFFAAKNEEDKSWRNLGRISFFIHGISIVGIFAVLFSLIYNHYFEYYYVWQHSSTILPIKYIFACFWEGQEGSFLLWAFWHVVLSLFIIRKAGTWEAPVMTTIAVVQFFLASMILGVYVFGYKIGSDPFILLREHPDMANLPFIQIPDYLSRMKDGRGLNPLLQNYWMVIHPPTLFLGFASTLIPFAYAIAGLWKNKVNEWIKPAIPWTFFGIMILGTGILMGAAWAYESLSFGGFWAWDPVENASLVPWLTFVGSAHLMLIYKHNGRSMKSALVLVVLTFLLILYSTFLTRSGILGNTSVHAFTDLGMSGQLLVYMSFFVVLAIVLLIKRWKNITDGKEEESISSREFWMYIGVLTLVISCFQITFTTSIPVINKLLGSNLAPPTNVKEHYNKWQLPIAVMLSLLIATTQYFKYKNTDFKYFIKKILPSFVFSVLFSGLSVWYLKLYQIHYFLLLWASVFAIAANVDYMLRIFKGKLKHSGASIAHVGFGFILLGALISTSGSQVISRNNSNVDLGKELPSNENIMLVKGDTSVMGGYFVTYKGKKKEGVNVSYEVEYYKQDEKSGKLNKQFSLFPILQLNPNMGNVSEPDTRHFFEKDIYTHLTYVNVDELKDEEHNGDYKEPVVKTVKAGDTITTSNSLIIFNSINKEVDRSKYDLTDADIVIGAKLTIIDINKKQYPAEPLFVVKGNYVYPIEDKVEDMGLIFYFKKLNPENGKIDLAIAEKKSNSKEFIVLKAIVFPFINFLWTGCVLMIIGTIIAIRKRLSGK